MVHMKTTLHTKIDKDIKEKAQSLANELGIPISTIINSQLREFVRSGTFQVSREPQLKESVWKEILKASKDAKEGKNISPEFTNVEDAKNWLNSKNKKWS
jgi:addiction module RelB/DinJ family antitoxin